TPPPPPPSLHDALPIFRAYDLATGRVLWSTENPDGNHLFPIAMDGDRLIAAQPGVAGFKGGEGRPGSSPSTRPAARPRSCGISRSEEHTSELQSRENLV